jgi:hypothetical protein
VSSAGRGRGGYAADDVALGRHGSMVTHGAATTRAAARATVTSRTLHRGRRQRLVSGSPSAVVCGERGRSVRQRR